MQARVERNLRGVDIISLGLATLCVVAAVVGLALQPVYLGMFEDLGGELPFFTRLMLRPITLIVAGFTPMILAAEGVVRRRSEAAQVARCVVALIAAVGLLAAFFGAMYLPVFNLAGEIR